MTLALAIECSTRAGSVAAGSGGRIAVELLAPDRAHASDLVPAMERALAALGATARELELVVVGTGPGSFTGLRVAVATAQGLARATGARTVGVPSFEAIAAEALEPGEEASVVQDARGGELYFARYRRAAGALETIEAPRVVARDELARTLPPEGRVLADAYCAALPEVAGRGPARVVVDPRPDARALLELGLARFADSGPDDPRAIEPLYLRAFAARRRSRGE